MRIAEQPSGETVVLASSELVMSLVDFLDGSSSRSGKDQCVVLATCALMGKMSRLMPALYAPITDCSPMADKKARWLIDKIHQVYKKRQPPPLVAPSAGERVIRV